MGGKHRASSYLDGRLAREEETGVAKKREAFALGKEFVAPF